MRGECGFPVDVEPLVNRRLLGIQGVIGLEDIYKLDLRCGAVKGRSTLRVYDTAIIDFKSLKPGKKTSASVWKKPGPPVATYP